MTIRRGDVWDVDTGKGVRTVLVVSLDGLADAYGVVVALVLHAPAAHPDTAMSVRLTSPIDASVVAVDVLQLAAARFDTATAHGNIGPEQLALVENALHAVLDL
ncbi:MULTISPECIES: type II toxin-antitoxin system PemK/MazF family toxin [unclassified Streptomyces]|uniref:type II toxin-antitoxin system PemK/MazF family toxin n=1 Tax=unclassified Streptomyces TaxID=2593676 RepID=UPI003322381B